MVFFDSQACALRARWDGIDVKSINFETSPFGLTVDGCKDFRGFSITGSSGAEHVFMQARFEKCDFTYAVFANCRMIKSVFVSCVLYAVDMHSCELIDCGMPACIRELIVAFQRPEPSNNFASVVNKFVSLLPHEQLRIITGLHQLSVQDLDCAVLVCVDLDSAPSLEILCLLEQYLAGVSSAVKLIVLDQSELAICKGVEQTLLNVLLDAVPCGLGEVAWIKDCRVLRSDQLACLPVRRVIADRLKMMSLIPAQDIDAMSEDRFWQIVDLTEPHILPYDPHSHAQRIRQVLGSLESDELVHFSSLLNSLKMQLYTFEIVTAASIIGTGCGDDGFSDFCCALLYRGQKVFYGVLSNTEEILLALDGAHYLMVEGFGNLVENVINEKRSVAGLGDYECAYLQGQGFGGKFVDDDRNAYKKCLPALYKKYWNKKKFVLEKSYLS